MSSTKHGAALADTKQSPQWSARRRGDACKGRSDAMRTGEDTTLAQARPPRSVEGSAKLKVWRSGRRCQVCQTRNFTTTASVRE